jgi:hypothetical protein
MKRILPFVYAILTTAILGAILFPFFARPSIYYHRTTSISKLKQLGTGHLIYAADYDERLPHSTSQTTIISQLNPYVKDDSLWDSVKDVSLPAKFNFNIAGALTTDKPIGYPKTDPTEITLLYALTDPKYKIQGAFQTRLDSSAKLIRLPELLDSLTLQFDRSGVTLAPPDYIAPTHEELQRQLKDQVK